MGLQAMPEMWIFSIGSNSFKGALPETGLQVMADMCLLDVDTNPFTGALPDLRDFTDLLVISVGNTCIQGHMSHISFSSCFVDAIVCHPLLDQNLQGGICQIEP
eukprot:6477818-Amphidinium_carterae.1